MDFGSDMIVEQVTNDVVKVRFINEGQSGYFSTDNPKYLLESVTKALESGDQDPETKAFYELAKKFYERLVYGA